MQTNPPMEQYTKIPLPDRKYIPGQGIHPDKDPKGSHIPEIKSGKGEFYTSNWSSNQKYLYSIITSLV